MGKAEIATKKMDVSILLVTPDGEPAPGCTFNIKPEFPGGGSALSKEVSLKTDDAGVATLRMSLLEPHTFEINQVQHGAQEYLPQRFTFQTDRPSVTAVVARSLFGTILEERAALVLDCSGSMGVYINEIRT